jgi:hypothetical protein
MTLCKSKMKIKTQTRLRADVMPRCLSFLKVLTKNFDWFKSLRFCFMRNPPSSFSTIRPSYILANWGSASPERHASSGGIPKRISNICSSGWKRYKAKTVKYKFLLKVRYGCTLVKSGVLLFLVHTYLPTVMHTYTYVLMILWVFERLAKSKE